MGSFWLAGWSEGVLAPATSTGGAGFAANFSGEGGSGSEAGWRDESGREAVKEESRGRLRWQSERRLI